jgi:signal transduction histidine kinase
MQIGENVSSILIIVFSLVLAILGFFFAVLVSKFYNKLKKRQKEALNNLIVGQNNERERLSRDLHDELGPTLSAIIFTLDAIKSENAEDIENKDLAKMQLKEAVTKVRQISHNLTSHTLKKYGLVSAITDIIDSSKRGGQLIVFNTNCQSCIFAENIESHLYKITQELILNTQKHSKARQINIDLQKNNEKYIYSFTDNGIGFKEQANLTHGIGLKNILTRVELINAKIKINGDNGFNLIIEF